MRCVLGLETNFAPFLVLSSCSVAGAPLLHGSAPAVRQCQVGCGNYTL